MARHARRRASLKTTLGDLDRVSTWLVVNAYVNAEPGYP